MKKFSLTLLLLVLLFASSCEEEENDTSWHCSAGTCIELFSDIGAYSSKFNCEANCGSPGGGGGGGNSTGEVSFWTRSDLGCGNITVNLQGVGTDIISGFYSNGFPGCGLNSNANFTVPRGTYTYTASCDGFTWPERSISVGSCTNVQLTN